MRPSQPRTYLCASKESCRLGSEGEWFYLIFFFPMPHQSGTALDQTLQYGLNSNQEKPSTGRKDRRFSLLQVRGFVPSDDLDTVRLIFLFLVIHLPQIQ